MIKIIKPDFEFKSENGELIQLVRDGWKQVNVLFSKKGASRGGHYHKICNEAFYIISGKIELLLEKDGIKNKVKFEKGSMFIVEPFVKHDFLFLEDTIMVALYDKGVELENGEKDIYE